MTADNDSVRAEFEQTMAPIFEQEFGMNPDPAAWHRTETGYVAMVVDQHYRTWQASRERYVPRWIPVGEPPKLHERVLIATTDANDFPHVTTATWNGKAGFLVRGGHRDRDVTHWQPIPATPNGGNES